MKLDDQELLAMLWELAPSAVGHGLVLEAGHALTHYAFRVSAATMVHAVVRIENQRAVATLQRAGMVQLQDIRTHHGAEVLLYGITRDDLDLSAARRSLRLTDQLHKPRSVAFGGGQEPTDVERAAPLAPHVERTGSISYTKVRERLQ